MPKGRAEERQFTCKNCGSLFTTDKVGKATWYCRSEVCDADRRAQGASIKPVGSYVPGSQARRGAGRRRREEHDEQYLRRRLKPGRKNVTDVLVKTELRLQRDIERVDARYERAAEREREKEHRAWVRSLARQQRRAEREEEKRQARVERNRRKANEKRLAEIRKRTRRRGLEAFGPIFDDADQMILFDELMEVMALAAVTPSEKIEAKKALVKITKAESQDEQHRGWQLLAAVSLKMADRFRPRQDRDPHMMIPDDDGESANDRTLVTA
jgi:hypothetical protein